MRKGNIIRSKRTKRVGLVLGKRKLKGRGRHKDIQTTVIDILIDDRVYSTSAGRLSKNFEVIDDDR